MMERKNKLYVKTFATLRKPTDHIAGPNPHLVDALETIQRSINEFEILDINGNPIGSSSSVILDSFFPLSAHSYIHLSTFGSAPPQVQTGTSDSIVTIQCGADCRIRKASLKGRASNTDLNGDKDIVFVGFGIPGNESIDDVYVPSIQLTRIGNESMFAAPTPDNPFIVNNENTPEIQVIGIGTANDPMLHIRLKSIDVYEAHYITFSW
jgi:hypothetical protein